METWLVMGVLSHVSEFDVKEGKPTITRHLIFNDDTKAQELQNQITQTEITPTICNHYTIEKSDKTGELRIKLYNDNVDIEIMEIRS